MANPQKEHGYTPIAHELLRAFIKAGLTGQQWAALMTVAMDSYGKSRKECHLSLREIANVMGVAKSRAAEALRALGVRRIVPPPMGTPERTHREKLRKINKDFDTWGGTLQRVGTLQRTHRGTLQRTTPRTRASESSNQSSTPRTTPRVPDPRIGRLIAGFYSLLESKLGEKPAAFNGGAAGKGFQKLLKTHQEPEISGRFAPWFESDDAFLVRRAYRIEDFFSNFNVLKGGSIHAGTPITKGAYFGVESPVGKYAHLSGGPGKQSGESEQ